MTDDLDILIARYLDGTASAEEVDQLEARLEADRGAASEVYQAAFYEMLLRDALGALPAHVGSESPSDLPTPRLRLYTAKIAGALHPRTLTKSPLVRWGSLAACLLVAVGMLWRATHIHAGKELAVVPDTAVALSHIAMSGPGIEVHRAAASQRGGLDGALSPNDEVRTSVGASASIAYDDESTRLTLAGDSSMRLAAGGGGKSWELVRGQVSCQVEHQKPGRSLIVSTTQAEVAVVGTQFDVSAAAGGTRVQVKQGTVRVTRKSDGATVDVSGGQFVDVPTPGASAVQLASPAQGRDLGEFWSVKLRPAGISR
jgi:hypothetical protein